MNKKITTIIFIGYYALLVYAAYVYKILQTGYKLDYFLIALCTPWLIHIIFKWLKLQMTLPIFVVNWTFCAFSTIFGSMLNFYRYAYFDKLLHFSSGVFLTTLCIMIFSLLHSLTMPSKKSCILQLLFINGLNMIFAFLWELYEFAILVFMDIDAINHYTAGVFDSMGDLIVCFIGGLIISCFTIHYFKTQHINFIYKAVYNFNKLNNIKDSTL